jgi:hypothetical protein
LGGSYATATDATTVTLSQAKTIGSGAVTVPFGVTLETGSWTLTVNSGATFTVAGTLDVDGGFTVTSGTLNNSGTINVESGGAQTYSGAIGTNTGTINIKGTSHAGGGTDLPGAGVNIVYAGGKVSFDGGTNYFIGTASDGNAEFALTSGTFSFNNVGYELDGAVTLKASKTFYAIRGSTPMKLKAGAVLSVDGSLVVKGIAGQSLDTVRKA